MKYHKLLDKQVKKHFKDGTELPAGFEEFLAVVNSTYNSFERDKQISEHAYMISEKEYQEVLNDMEAQNNIRHQSIVKLKEAINSLDPSATIPFDIASDELIDVVSYLEKQIQKTKLLEVELTKARDAAEKAAKAKGDFLSVMSHEIRTPLNAIIGIAHLMMNDEMPVSQMENMRTLNISAENLLNLINDILDFSKIEEGKIELSERSIDLRQLVNNIKMANRIRAEERGNIMKVLLDADLPQYLSIDEVRLGQVLNNLVSNAVKFTRNGFITIEVSVAKNTPTHSSIYFAVTDTGIGIEKDKQQLIFEHFSQANSEITREFGGSGLGLAIIKRLLSLMKTDIHVESIPGKGAKFYFTIDFKKGTAPLEVNKPKNGQVLSDLAGLKILLVEDVEFNVMVAEKMLTNWNAKVEVAENGLQAIGKVREGNFDIILMDLQMPILDGYSASRNIREFNNNIPIIALTASASSDVQERTKEAGMNGYVSKPFKPADLFDTITKFTGKQAS